MKTIRHIDPRPGNEILHVETPLAIVNIQVGLHDQDGRRVDSVRVSPSNYVGEPIRVLAGSRVVELLDGEFRLHPRLPGEPRTPDEILADYDSATRHGGHIDDPRGLLWEALEDIFSTFRLAMETAGVDETVAARINETVTDYMVNNWGDD